MALKTLAFQDADIQALVEARMGAEPGMKQAAAIRAVFNELNEAAHNRPSTFTELEYTQLYNANQENLARIIALETEAAEKDAEITALKHDKFALATENGVLKDADTFADLSTIPAEAAEHLRTVRNEILQAQLHPSTAHWISAMLRNMQTLPDVDGKETRGYIPESNEIVKEEWLQ